MVTEDLHTRECSHSNGNWGLTYKVTILAEMISDKCYNMWCKSFLNSVRVFDMCTIYYHNSVHSWHITCVYSHRNGNWGLTYKVTILAEMTSDKCYICEVKDFWIVLEYSICVWYIITIVYIAGTSQVDIFIAMVTEDLHTTQQFLLRWLLTNVIICDVKAFWIRLEYLICVRYIITIVYIAGTSHVYILIEMVTEDLHTK